MTMPVGPSEPLLPPEPLKAILVIEWDLMVRPNDTNPLLPLQQAMAAVVSIEGKEPSNAYMGIKEFAESIIQRFKDA